MRMELSMSPHKDSMRPVLAKWVRMKFKSGMVGTLALTMWRIACRHTKRDRSCISALGQAVSLLAMQLRRRTRRDSRKGTDSMVGTSEGIMCLGILAANLRNLCLSPTASWLNNQATLS